MSADSAAPASASARASAPPAALAPSEPVPREPALHQPAPPCNDSSPDPGIDPLGDEIALLCAHINAATYKLLRLLARYDEEGHWEGFRSCAHWLSWRTGISIGPAREKMRVARCLPSLPLISGALARGEVSYSKVRAMTRVATADNEAELLTIARHGTTAHVERLVRQWRRLDQGVDSLAARNERRGLSLWLTDDGNYDVRGRLTPEVGALLLKALEVAEDQLYRAEREAGREHKTSATQRRADALGLWLEEQLEPQVQLVVHSFEGGGEKVEAPASLVTEDGSRVSAETSSRLACDAEVVPIKRGADGTVLDIGRRKRTVDWRLRKALEARDGGCRFPGCGSRMRTHAHHITPWAEGGDTNMNNLVLLCPFHHRAVHEGGWRVEMDERGVPGFFNPLGARMPVAPAAPDVSGLVPRKAPADLPAEPPASPTQDFGLAHWHGHHRIDPPTGSTLWQGERLDLNWALEWFLGEGGGGGQAENVMHT